MKLFQAFTRNSAPSVLKLSQNNRLPADNIHTLYTHVICLKSFRRQEPYLLRQIGLAVRAENTTALNIATKTAHHLAADLKTSEAKTLSIFADQMLILNKM